MKRLMFFGLMLIASISIAQEINYPVPEPEVVVETNKNIFNGIVLMYTTESFNTPFFSGGYQSDIFGFVTGGFYEFERFKFGFGEQNIVGFAEQIFVYSNFSFGSDIFIKPILGMCLQKTNVKVEIPMVSGNQFIKEIDELIMQIENEYGQVLSVSKNGMIYRIDETVFSPTTGFKIVYGPLIFDTFYTWRLKSIYTGIGIMIPNRFWRSKFWR